jgi:hypothetical protein
MPQSITTTTVNNFSKGLITEATGLNFPENACTEVDNCIFTLLGDVTRRQGFDFETNSTFQGINSTGVAVNTYKWNNAGGDGQTQVVVEQVGPNLIFYVSSSATLGSPLSTQRLTSTVSVNDFTPTGVTFDPTQECEFADGNGYLFVYHPSCDPFYCTFVEGVVTGNVILMQIRDFTGVTETSVAVNFRPPSLSPLHLYNLQNQGWTAGNAWGATATGYSPNIVQNGNMTLTVEAGITGIVAGQTISVVNQLQLEPGGAVVPTGTVIMTGNVVSYSGTQLLFTVSSFLPIMALDSMAGNATISPIDVGFINTWQTDLGNFPSNADVWWYFKDDTDTFNPSTTVSNVTLSTSNAPQGHFILDVFSQNKSNVSGVPGLTTIQTTKRPTNGTWFAGRVWFTGVSAQQAATTDAPFYTWTENIYFSQIVETVTDFGLCYQDNDPTSEQLFNLLPTDGGVITVQGSGAIYKLYPIQNGMLVFAANGVWFITGSQGIGFTADDYTITKISSVQSISKTSFVDVLGLPYFWNEEAIYSVQPQQGGSLTVTPITLGTIATFYSQIPVECKQFARGAYHPINYVLQWVYNDTPDNGDITARYSFNNALSFNTYNKGFYPYTISSGQPVINGLIYVSSPVPGMSTEDPVFKYPTSVNNAMTFSEENSDTFMDWFTLDQVGVNYVSFFTSGYAIRGQGIKKSQPQYIIVYSNTDGGPSSYKIQGIWDYANTGNSGRFSTQQLVTNGLTNNYNVVMRRHKIRGRGYTLQFQITSADGQPFDIIGWSTVDTTNQGT